MAGLPDAPSVALTLEPLATKEELPPATHSYLTSDLWPSAVGSKAATAKVFTLHPNAPPEVIGRESLSLKHCPELSRKQLSVSCDDQGVVTVAAGGLNATQVFHEGKVTRLDKTEREKKTGSAQHTQSCELKDGAILFVLMGSLPYRVKLVKQGFLPSTGTLATTAGLSAVLGLPALSVGQRYGLDWAESLQAAAGPLLQGCQSILKELAGLQQQALLEGVGSGGGVSKQLRSPAQLSIAFLLDPTLAAGSDIQAAWSGFLRQVGDAASKGSSAGAGGGGGAGAGSEVEAKVRLLETGFPQRSLLTLKPATGGAGAATAELQVFLSLVAVDAAKTTAAAAAGGDAAAASAGKSGGGAAAAGGASSSAELSLQSIPLHCLQAEDILLHSSRGGGGGGEGRSEAGAAGRGRKEGSASDLPAGTASILAVQSNWRLKKDPQDWPMSLLYSCSNNKLEELRSSQWKSPGQEPGIGIGACLRLSLQPASSTSAASRAKEGGRGAAVALDFSSTSLHQQLGWQCLLFAIPPAVKAAVMNAVKDRGTALQQLKTCYSSVFTQAQQAIVELWRQHLSDCKLQEQQLPGAGAFPGGADFASGSQGGDFSSAAAGAAAAAAAELGFVAKSSLEEEEAMVEAPSDIGESLRMGLQSATAALKASGARNGRVAAGEDGPPAGGGAGVGGASGLPVSLPKFLARNLPPGFLLPPGTSSSSSSSSGYGHASRQRAPVEQPSRLAGRGDTRASAVLIAEEEEEEGGLSEVVVPRGHGKRAHSAVSADDSPPRRTEAACHSSSSSGISTAATERRRAMQGEGASAEEAGEHPAAAAAGTKKQRLGSGSATLTPSTTALQRVPSARAGDGAGDRDGDDSQRAEQEDAEKEEAAGWEEEMREAALEDEDVNSSFLMVMQQQPSQGESQYGSGSAAGRGAGGEGGSHSSGWSPAFSLLPYVLTPHRFMPIPVLWEDSKQVVLLDKFPKARLHLLAMPKQDSPLFCNKLSDLHFCNCKHQRLLQSLGQGSSSKRGASKAGKSRQSNTLDTFFHSSSSTLGGGGGGGGGGGASSSGDEAGASSPSASPAGKGGKAFAAAGAAAGAAGPVASAELIKALRDLKKVGRYVAEQQARKLLRGAEAAAGGSSRASSSAAAAAASSSSYFTGAAASASASAPTVHGAPAPSLLIGFHCLPSLVPLHLHLLSGDLCSPALKTSKHYRSFSTEFLIPLDAVLDVAERGEASDRHNEVCRLLADKKLGEALLAGKGRGSPLICHVCSASLSNMPKLKEHLLRHFP